MEIIKLRPYSMFGTNSYIIHDGEIAALIDAPGNNAEAEKALADNGLRLEKILLTHGHCDHITGLAGMSVIPMRRFSYTKRTSPNYRTHIIILRNISGCLPYPSRTERSLR